MIRLLPDIKILLVFLPDIDYVSANIHGDIMTNNCNIEYFRVT